MADVASTRGCGKGSCWRVGQSADRLLQHPCNQNLRRFLSSKLFLCSDASESFRNKLKFGNIGSKYCTPGCRAVEKARQIHWQGCSSCQSRGRLLRCSSLRQRQTETEKAAVIHAAATISCRAAQRSTSLTCRQLFLLFPTPPSAPHRPSAITRPPLHWHRTQW